MRHIFTPGRVAKTPIPCSPVLLMRCDATQSFRPSWQHKGKEVLLIKSSQKHANMFFSTRRHFTIQINHAGSDLLRVFRDADLRLKRNGICTRVRTKSVYGSDLQLDIYCDKDEDRLGHLRTLWNAFPDLAQIAFELGLTK